jgi:hypothetical protein
MSAKKRSLDNDSDDADASRKMSKHDDDDNGCEEKASPEDVKKRRELTKRLQRANKSVRAVSGDARIALDRDFFGPEDVASLIKLETALKTRIEIVKKEESSIIFGYDGISEEELVTIQKRCQFILKNETTRPLRELKLVSNLEETLSDDEDTLENHYTCRCICHLCPNCGGDGGDCCPKEYTSQCHCEC